MSTEMSKLPGLYIHIPFCIRKCHYCSFYSITSTSLIPDFLKALSREMELVRDQWNSPSEPFDTIYIGGGTPSLLSLDQAESILTHVKKNFLLLADAEITLESNPGDLSSFYLRALRKIGINRLNI